MDGSIQDLRDRLRGPTPRIDEPPAPALSCAAKQLLRDIDDFDLFQVVARRTSQPSAPVATPPRKPQPRGASLSPRAAALQDGSVPASTGWRETEARGPKETPVADAAQKALVDAGGSVTQVMSTQCGDGDTASPARTGLQVKWNGSMGRVMLESTKHLYFDTLLDRAGQGL